MPYACCTIRYTYTCKRGAIIERVLPYACSTPLHAHRLQGRAFIEGVIPQRLYVVFHIDAAQIRALGKGISSYIFHAAGGHGYRGEITLIEGVIGDNLGIAVYIDLVGSIRRSHRRMVGIILISQIFHAVSYVIAYAAAKGVFPHARYCGGDRYLGNAAAICKSLCFYAGNPFFYCESNDTRVNAVDQLLGDNTRTADGGFAVRIDDILHAAAAARFHIAVGRNGYG